ncbi:MAG TPA: hypothetical protein HPP76_01225 [Desulfuromonadales bacterium]|nr:hypothetical protein [Desulfuromonadales bacterium]
MNPVTLNLLLFSVADVLFAVDAEQIADVATYHGEDEDDLFWFHEEAGLTDRTVTYEAFAKLQKVPSPLAGEGEGGGVGCHEISTLLLHPPPNPLPSREGECNSKTFARGSYISPTIISITTGASDSYRVIIDSIVDIAECNISEIRPFPPLVEQFAVQKGMWGVVVRHNVIVVLIDFLRMRKEKRSGCVPDSNKQAGTDNL